MKKFRFTFLFVFLLILFNTTPAYADGGIPLWIYTAESAYSSFAVKGFENVSFILGTIFLLYVVFLEIVVFLFIDKNKKITFIEKAYSVIIVNILSTIAGAIFTIPILYNVKTEPFTGPGLLIFPMHIFCFVLSCIVEFYTYKLFFSKKVDSAFLKKLTIWTNIWTYFILNPFTIVLIIFGTTCLFEYLSNAMTYDRKVENVSLLKTPIIVNEVKIISPYFKPNTVSFLKCQKLQKLGYPIDDCKYRPGTHYWLGIDAIRQCEDINGRLPNNYELARITEYLYNKPYKSIDFPLSDGYRLERNLSYDSNKAKTAYLPIQANYDLFSYNKSKSQGMQEYRRFKETSTDGLGSGHTYNGEPMYAICVAK